MVKVKKPFDDCFLLSQNLVKFGKTNFSEQFQIYCILFQRSTNDVSVMVSRQNGNCILLFMQTYFQACFVLNIIHVSSAILDSRSFKQARGLTLSGPILWNDSDVHSAIHCIIACTHHKDECYAVGFSTVHMNCSYFQWFLNSVPLRAVVGMDSDRVILVKSTPGKYSLSWFCPQPFRDQVYL